MHKIIYCMRRKPAMTHAQFVEYWRQVHAPIVLEHRSTLRVARYVQTVPVEHPYSARVERRETLGEPYDGVAELYWANEHDLRHAFEDEDAKRVQVRLARDELHFVDHSRSVRWISREFVAIAP